MVSSAPSSPSLGGRRGDPGGQLLQELEALSQALYRSSQSGPGSSGSLAAAAAAGRKDVPSPIKGGKRREALPPVPRSGQQQLKVGGAVPHLSLPSAGRRQREAEVVKELEQDVKGEAGKNAGQKTGERQLQPWHSQGFERNLPEVTNFPAWLEDNLNFSKKLEAPMEKKSWRDWKPFRALAQLGQQKFNCLFTVHVHGIEGMLPVMNGMRLAVALKRKDASAQTAAVRVFQGAAEFDETMSLKSTIYGSREAKSNVIKYMSKSFTLSVVGVDVHELVLGKHRLDLSRLLPETYDGKVEEVKVATSTSTFKLSGKAKGGSLVVTFGYEILDAKDFRNLSNSSSRFMESPTRRAVRSFNSLPNSAQGTPRMRPSDVHLSPSLSESDVNEYLGIEHLSLDDAADDKTYKLNIRPTGLPRSGSDVKFKAFAQQLDGKPKLFPHPHSVLAPQTPTQSKSVSEHKRDPGVGLKGEEEYVSSEDDGEFIVEDRGVELGSLPETVAGRLVTERKPDHPLQGVIQHLVIREEERQEQEEEPVLEEGLQVHKVIATPLTEEDEVEVSRPKVEPHGSKEQEEVFAQQGGVEEAIKQELEEEEEEEQEDKEGEEVSSLRLELEKFEKSLNETPEKLELESRGQWEDGVGEDLHEEFKDSQVVDEQELGPAGMEQGWESKDPSDALGQPRMHLAPEESPHDIANEAFLEPAQDVSDLDNEVDLVAGEFLDMLENEPAPSIGGSSSNSPRGLLLRQFEQESLLDLGPAVLGCDDSYVPELSLDDDAAGSLNLEELIDELDPLESQAVDGGGAWGDVDDDTELAVFMEVAETEMKKATQVMQSKSRAKMIEDEETEALMAEWGLNEKAFESSPPKRVSSPRYGSSFGSPLMMRLPEPPALASHLGPVVATRDGGSLRSMSPAHFQASNISGKLVMQVSKPVVVPAGMGSSAVDILRRIAASGMESMAFQAMMAMPLDDISGKTVEQVASEGLAALEGNGQRKGMNFLARNGYALPPGESARALSLEYGDNKEWAGGTLSNRAGMPVNKPGSARWGGRTGELEAWDDNVSLEGLAPLAMQKIESLAMEGLKIQAEMTDEVAPYNVDAISWEHLAALEDTKPRRGKGIGMLEGVAALPLVEGLRQPEEKQSGDVDGLMSMAISLEEWMRLDAGVYDEPEVNEKTLAILAAHHAVHKDHRDLVVMNQKSEHEKSRGRQGPGVQTSFGTAGCMGDTLTLAMLVQLRDPLRNFEPVGAPMMALVQAERVLIPPKPRIGRRVSIKGNSEEVEEVEKPKEEEALAPVFKITNVTMSGLQTSGDEKKKETKGWGNQKQQQSGSRWLVANGMGKGSKPSGLKSKPAPPAKTKVKQGESLWSISAKVHGTGSKWKEVAALNPHIRNPNVIFPNDTIRTR